MFWINFHKKINCYDYVSMSMIMSSMTEYDV